MEQTWHYSAVMRCTIRTRGLLLWSKAPEVQGSVPPAGALKAPEDVSNLHRPHYNFCVQQQEGAQRLLCTYHVRSYTEGAIQKELHEQRDTRRYYILHWKENSVCASFLRANILLSDQMVNSIDKSSFDGICICKQNFIFNLFWDDPANLCWYPLGSFFKSPENRRASRVLL